MPRDYQLDYSTLKPSVFDTAARERKATTILSVCQDFLGRDKLSDLVLLDVGSSSGIIDNYLADHFHAVFGIDIDERAMKHAQESFDKPNLTFSFGDAMQLSSPNDSIDVVVCSHVYEHVPDAGQLFDEIRRVLKPGGFCYFSGNNRIMLMEPHYHLPLLSMLPRPLAHLYMRLAGKGRHYHEKHLSYRKLKRLCSGFEITDYSEKIIADPLRFGADYMLQPGSVKQRVALWIAQHVKWATPHVWILVKPATDNVDQRIAPGA